MDGFPWSFQATLLWSISARGKSVNGKDFGEGQIRVPTLPWPFAGPMTLGYPVATSRCLSFLSWKGRVITHTLNHIYLVRMNPSVFKSLSTDSGIYQAFTQSSSYYFRNAFWLMSCWTINAALSISFLGHCVHSLGFMLWFCLCKVQKTSRANIHREKSGKSCPLGRRGHAAGLLGALSFFLEIIYIYVHKANHSFAWSWAQPADKQWETGS